jgi:hypothetical protein
MMAGPLVPVLRDATVGRKKMFVKIKTVSFLGDTFSDPMPLQQPGLLGVNDGD